MTNKMPDQAAVAAQDAPVCVACVGDRTNPAGGLCLRCNGTGADPDPLAPVWPGNPMTALRPASAAGPLELARETTRQVGCECGARPGCACDGRGGMHLGRYAEARRLGRITAGQLFCAVEAAGVAANDQIVPGGAR